MSDFAEADSLLGLKNSCNSGARCDSAAVIDGRMPGLRLTSLEPTPTVAPSRPAGVSIRALGDTGCEGFRHCQRGGGSARGGSGHRSRNRAIPIFLGESSGARAGAFAMLAPERVGRLVLSAFTWTGLGSPTLTKRGEALAFF